MENIYNFGTEQTTCEEHHYPNDPYYTVKGSCPLKYSLDFDSVKNSKRIDNLYDLLDITEIPKIIWIYFFTALIAVWLIVYLFYVIISHCLTDLHSRTSARKSPTYLHDDYDTMRNDPNNTTMSDDVEFFCEPANVLENMWEEPPPPYTTLYPSSNSSYGEAPSCGFRPGYFPQALSPPEFCPPFDVTQEYRHQTYCDEEDAFSLTQHVIPLMEETEDIEVPCRSNEFPIIVSNALLQIASIFDQPTSVAPSAPLWESDEDVPLFKLC